MFFFKQKTAYEMRISDWSSDVCSSDLIKAGNGGDIDVDLRNPEYDISRAIRKVLYAYRSGGDLFANLPAPVTLEAYVSPEAELPEPLPQPRRDLEALISELTAEGGGQSTAELRDPRSEERRVGKWCVSTC